jgi:hypothetical protein
VKITRFDSRQGLRFILVASGAHSAPYPIRTGGKAQPEHEAAQSCPSNSEVKNAWSYTSSSPKEIGWEGVD